MRAPMANIVSQCAEPLGKDLFQLWEVSTVDDSSDFLAGPFGFEFQ